MNNAFINKEYEVASDENLVSYREQVTRLTEVIEALQNIQGSSYWKVLEKELFEVELSRSRRQLEKESEPTKIYRLQGEIALSKRYDLEDQITRKKLELQALKSKLTQPL